MTLVLGAEQGYALASCGCGFVATATGPGADLLVDARMRNHGCTVSANRQGPLAGHAGSCDKVTRAQTHGTFDGRCSCGQEPA